MVACCTGCSSGTCLSLFCSAYHAGRPSSAVTDFPRTAETGVTQDRVSTPFTRTEQAPHWPSPQPNRGPRNSSSFESTYNRGVSAADVTFHRPLLTSITSSVATAVGVEVIMIGRQPD